MQEIFAIPAKTDRLAEAAGFFTVLAEFFLHNPDARLVRSCRALEAGGADPAVGKALARIRDYAARCGETEADEAFLDLKRDWTKLFRAISPTYGPTAPYGLMFVRGDAARMMATIAGMYAEGGYDGFTRYKERLDYIGIGFQFLATLELLRLHAARDTDPGEFVRLSALRKKFLTGFFMPWAIEFCKRAYGYARTDFFRAVLDLTCAALSAYGHRIETLPDLKSESEARQEAVQAVSLAQAIEESARRPLPAGHA